MTSFRVLLVSEFPAQSGAPTGALASDLVEFLVHTKHLNVRFIKASGKYVPGGMSASRLWNLIYLHLSVCIIFPFELVKAFLLKSHLCIIATTSPPLIQWTCAIVARLLRIPVIVWFQDAHPEIEARALEDRNWPRVAKILRALDEKISRSYSSFVTLDEAMRRSFLNRTRYSRPSAAIPPWGTYIDPAKPFRPPSHQHLRLIYAGNYGKVHDLKPLAEALSRAGKKADRILSITFVGMNDDGQKKLQQIFSAFSLSLEFKPRFASVERLVEEFHHFDCGIVSLAEDCSGVACPSKALTYLSQGLPILYVGPEQTLSWQLCQEGWGVLLDEIFEIDEKAWIGKMSAHAGKIFPNPRLTAQECFYEFIDALNKR